ncbi:MAG: ATP-binding protein [Sarcina sp.]
MLPKAERVEVNKNNYKKIWIYGAPFSGKTTLADESPMPINLNTDGNVKYVTMQRLPIKDEVKVEGRITKRKYAWEILSDAVNEFEKGGTGFETIVVDLIEDTHEHCRLYMYNKLGITHESDDSFRAWDKIRLEFLPLYKRLINLPYNIILISHEDMSKDITKKSGDKITSIKPNINDKIATKLAGMVDIVARVVIEDDDSRTLNFKTNEVVFGGGRLKGVKAKKIPLSWDALMKVYEEANSGKTEKVEEATKEEKRSRRSKKEEVKEEPQESVDTYEEPKKEESRKSRKPKEKAAEEPKVEETEIETQEEVKEPVIENTKEETQSVEEQPKTRRRRKKKDEEIKEEDIPF